MAVSARSAGKVEFPPTPAPAADDAGIIQLPSPTAQPAVTPDEPWVELAQLRKVSPAEIWEVVEMLRSAGVAVLGAEPRLSGLFSKRIDVQLRVPLRMQTKAKCILAERQSYNQIAPAGR